jgi:hypothetical protein
MLASLPPDSALLARFASQHVRRGENRREPAKVTRAVREMTASDFFGADPIQCRGQ